MKTKYSGRKAKKMIDWGIAAVVLRRVLERVVDMNCEWMNREGWTDD
jgi:hypothetical protein